MKKLISFFTVALFLCFSMNSIAQTANTYTFSTSTGAALEDMTGATVLQTAPNDDSPSLLTTFPDGFSFVYETIGYTEFSTTPDGFLKLGSPVAVSQFTNAIVSTTNRPKVFPLWDDLALGTAVGGGNVSYKIFGSSPNRKFVVQWFVTIPRNTTGDANSTFQLWLNENGVIDFVYGTVGVAPSSSVGINSVAANATNFMSVTISSNTSSTTTANNTNAAAPESGRQYTFTPFVQLACNIIISNLNPVGTIFPGCGSTYAPKVNISNNGTDAQTDVSVNYTVGAYNETVTGLSLAAGANMDVDFPNTLSYSSFDAGVKNVTVTVNATCNGSVQYVLNTDFTVSPLNPNFGGPVDGYYFANSTSGADCAPDQPFVEWEDTTGSTDLLLNGRNVSPAGTLFGSIDDGFFALGDALDGVQRFFRYQDVNYDSFFVGTNGMIAFSRANNTQGQLTTFTPLAIPGTAAPRPAIFPFWKDFNYSDSIDVPVSRLSYKVMADRIVFTYDRAPNFNTAADPDDYASFQVVLEISPAPTGDGWIQVNYNEAGTGSSFLAKYFGLTLATHTVGQQNLAGNSAIQYRRFLSPTLVNSGPLYTSSVSVAYGPDVNALPVELASFSASTTGNNVDLNWATTTETNNQGFEIERSSVNGSWTKIGNVSGNGTTTSPHSYTYRDRNVATGNYNYRLKQIDFNGNFEYFNLSSEVNVGIPTKFDLSQNYPNPFNPSTSINFDLPVDGNVSLKIFDMTGREVMTLVNEVKTAGYYSVSFNASNLSSGAYFYRISAGDFTATKKMTLIK